MPGAPRRSKALRLTDLIPSRLNFDGRPRTAEERPGAQNHCRNHRHRLAALHPPAATTCYLAAGVRQHWQ